jgi:hypothetical protein
MNTHLLPFTESFSTFQTKPSRIRRAEDEHIAATLAKTHGYADYDPSMNPHPPDDVIRHDRVRRIYEVLVRQYRTYEPIFRDICAAYGYDPCTEATQRTP